MIFQFRWYSDVRAFVQVECPKIPTVAIYELAHIDIPNTCPIHGAKNTNYWEYV